MIWLLLKVAFSGVLMHPVHETFCEIHWNAQEKRAEVALRLSIQDEQWIIKHHRRLNEAADETKGAESTWQQRFLKTQLVFDPVQSTKRRSVWPKGRGLTRWLGRKEEGGYVWWFFEIARDDGKQVRNVQTRLLFDLDESYQHRMLVLSTKKAVVLSKQKPSAALEF